jgi:hypothetical protein
VDLQRAWDQQNRLFCNVYGSWMAAAYTSPADVKELAPARLENPSALPLTTTTEGGGVPCVNA